MFTERQISDVVAFSVTHTAIMTARPPKLLKLPSIEVEGIKRMVSNDDENVRQRKREASINLKEVASHEDLSKQSSSLL